MSTTTKDWMAAYLDLEMRAHALDKQRLALLHMATAALDTARRGEPDMDLIRSAMNCIAQIGIHPDDWQPTIPAQPLIGEEGK